MSGLSSWLDGNWFNVMQTTGIMGSLWLTVMAARREAKVKKIENLLTLSEHHRALWSDVSQRRELARIFQNNEDALSSSLTLAEEEFINLAIVHFQTGWRVAKNGGLTSLKELGADVRGFFSLPLPRAVWEKTRKSRNQKFVRFVERSLAG
jgi:hypothetical protein